MNPIEIFTQYANSLALIGIAVYFAYDKWLSGSNQRRKEIDADNETRIRQLTVQVQELKVKLETVNQEFGGLQATLREKEKHNADLRELLADKNPAVLELLAEIKEFMKLMHQQNREELLKQTKMLEEGKERDSKVDLASITKTGEIMREPTHVK